MDGGTGVQGQVRLHVNVPTATVCWFTITADAEAAGSRTLQGVVGEEHPQRHRECFRVTVC